MHSGIEQIVNQSRWSTRPAQSTERRS